MFIHAITASRQSHALIFCIACYKYDYKDRLESHLTTSTCFHYLVIVHRQVLYKKRLQVANPTKRNKYGFLDMTPKTQICKTKVGLHSFRLHCLLVYNGSIGHTGLEKSTRPCTKILITILLHPVR